MSYIMLDIIDDQDYDCRDYEICSTLKAVQGLMEAYLVADGLYPKFRLFEAAFRNGILVEASKDISHIYTTYENRNGVKVPVMKVKEGT